MSAAALAASVDDAEFMDRSGILALQRTKLAALGRRLQADASWRAHFATAGLTPIDLAAPDGLAASPMLEKADLRAFYPFPFLTIAPEQVARFVATSGTTGLPVLFGMSHADVEWLLPHQMARIFRAVGLRPGERVYQGYGYGMWIGGVAMDIGLKAYGAANIGMGPGRGELAVAWLRDLAITACTMSPLWLMTLAGLARSHGIDPRRDWRLAWAYSAVSPFRQRSAPSWRRRCRMASWRITSTARPKPAGRLSAFPARTAMPATRCT